MPRKRCHEGRGGGYECCVTPHGWQKGWIRSCGDLAVLWSFAAKESNQLLPTRGQEIRVRPKHHFNSSLRHEWPSTRKPARPRTND